MFITAQLQLLVGTVDIVAVDIVDIGVNCDAGKSLGYRREEGRRKNKKTLRHGDMFC